MFCDNCGKEIENDSKFCSFCGREITDNVIGGLCKNISDIDRFLFLNHLDESGKRRKIFDIITEVVGVITFLLIVSFIFEQYQLDEGYVFWIYILRFMVKFGVLLFMLSIMQFISELLTYRIKDLKKPELKTTWLLCKIGILLANLIVFYPFIAVSDGVLAGWVLRFAFVGVDEFFYEFRIQWIAYMVNIILGVYVDKCIEKKRDN